MKTATFVFALLLSGPAYADCTRLTAAGPSGVTNLRGGPSMDYSIQHQILSVGNGNEAGTLLWCGKARENDMGRSPTVWLYVAYKVVGSSTWYYGWISRKVVIPFTGTVTAEGSPTDNFLEGRSAYPGE